VGKSSKSVDYFNILLGFSENSMKLLAIFACFVSKEGLELILVNFLRDSFSAISSLTYFL